MPRLDVSAKSAQEKAHEAMAVLEPLGDKMLIMLIEQGNVTEGGIHLPDVAKERPKEGKVIALGQGKRLDDGSRSKFDVEVGDTVIFAKYAGNTYEYRGETYLFAVETDLLGRVKKPSGS